MADQASIADVGVGRRRPRTYDIREKCHSSLHEGHDFIHADLTNGFNDGIRHDTLHDIVVKRSMLVSCGICLWSCGRRVHLHSVTSLTASPRLAPTAHRKTNSTRGDSTKSSKSISFFVNLPLNRTSNLSTVLYRLQLYNLPPSADSLSAPLPPAFASGTYSYMGNSQQNTCRTTRGKSS